MSLSDPHFDSDTHLVTNLIECYHFWVYFWWSCLQTPTFLFLQRKGLIIPSSTCTHPIHPSEWTASLEFFLKSSPMNPTFPNYGLWLWHVSTIAIGHTMSAGTSWDLRVQNHLQRKLGYNESEDDVMVKNSCIKEKMMPIWFIWITYFSSECVLPSNIEHRFGRKEINSFKLHLH